MASTEFTAKVKLTYSDGSDSLTGTVTQTASGREGAIIDLTANESAHAFDFAFDKDKLKEFYAISTTDATLHTNSSTGTDTISLNATVPLWWSSTSAVANPFSASVTSIYADNGSSTLPGQLDLRILFDADV